jgi:hypothetical protein
MFNENLQHSTLTIVLLRSPMQAVRELNKSSYFNIATCTWSLKLNKNVFMYFRGNFTHTHTHIYIYIYINFSPEPDRARNTSPTRRKHNLNNT